MNGRKFLGFLVIVFAAALLAYWLSTPRGNDIPLIGVVDGTEIVVSPQITGRIVRLNVDEGSAVKKGDLLAELDRSELQAAVASQAANIASLQARVAQEQHSWDWTNDQTQASVTQAGAALASAQSQLAEARANLWRDQVDYHRIQSLFDSGVASAQDRDRAEAAFKASDAHVKSLQDQVKMQQAQLAVAQANRKQLAVQQSNVASLRAQVAQAQADTAESQTRLGYTRIYAPIDGIVSVRVARQGEVLAQGAPIVVLVDVDHLWVRADVEENYIDALHFGDKLKVKLPSGRLLDGTLFFKGVENDFATQRDVSRTKRDIKTFAIKVAVPNPQRELFTGMTATVLLPPPPEKRHWYNAL